MLECTNCKLKYYSFQNKLCEFCDIIINLNKSHTYKYVICYSKISQEDIIKKTYEYFIKNNTIPLPKEIDPDSVIINVNPYLFKTNIKNSNYKIFFTNCIDKNNIKARKIGEKFKQNEKFNCDLYNGEDLKKIDENTYNEYLNILNI